MTATKGASLMRFEREEIGLSSGVLPCLVAGSGSPTLYLHGGQGVEISDALLGLAKGRQIYVPVMPGFDGTQRHDGVNSVRQLGNLLGEFVDKRIGHSCDIIGHSFGGWVAMWLAAQSPASMDHLVLEAPIGFVPESRAGVTGNGVEQALMVAHPERMTAPAKDADVARQNQRAVAHYAGEAREDTDLISALPRIGSVTLLLAGTHDVVAAPESLRLLKSLMPKCHLLYVYDAAHCIEVDQPDRFQRVVADFLDWGEAFLVNRADQRVRPGDRGTAGPPAS
jgi:pimeloyl-ACP methyl ester carboxylesterase